MYEFKVYLNQDCALQTVRPIKSFQLKDGILSLYSEDNQSGYLVAVVPISNVYKMVLEAQ